MAVSYPYDPTGVASTNLIVDELHSVQPPSAISRASFIVLRASPFFLEGVELYTGPNKTGTRLIPNKDYFYTHKFVAGTTYLGRTLYGSILSLTRTTLVTFTHTTKPLVVTSLLMMLLSLSALQTNIIKIFVS